MQRQFEEAFVEVVQLGDSLAEGDNCRSWLGFAFRFLIFGIDTVEIGVS